MKNLRVYNAMRKLAAESPALQNTGVSVRPSVGQMLTNFVRNPFSLPSGLGMISNDMFRDGARWLYGKASAGLKNFSKNPYMYESKVRDWIDSAATASRHAADIVNMNGMPQFNRYLRRFLEENRDTLFPIAQRAGRLSRRAVDAFKNKFKGFSLDLNPDNQRDLQKLLNSYKEGYRKGNQPLFIPELYRFKPGPAEPVKPNPAIEDMLLSVQQSKGAKLPTR